MAIAFDAATNFTRVNPGTSLTFAHTCTGSDLMLFVGIISDHDRVNGVTYNSVSATLVQKQSPYDGGTATIYLYCLPGPSTGTNNVVISVSSSDQITGGATSYTGCLQSSTLDASVENHGTATSFSKAITSTADNCWAVAVVRNDVGEVVAPGAGCTRRASNGSGGTAGFAAMLDSTSAIHPAGSFTMSGSWTTNITYGVIVATVAPVAPPPSILGRMFAVF